jgi:hypothetical protein
VQLLARSCEIASEAVLAGANFGKYVDRFGTDHVQVGLDCGVSGAQEGVCRCFFREFAGNRRFVSVS